MADLLGADAADEHVEHLALLAGIDDRVDAPDRETLFFSARLFVEAVAARDPTLLLFEDIHWADASLLDLIETLAARVRDVPVLFLALARPEMLTERPGWAGGLPTYTALPLDRLSEEAALELTQLLLERREASDPRASRIAATSEGNPLFIEELAASVAERSTGDTELPTSVRAIISARLDALPVEERGLLVDASVVGRVFWRGVLSRIGSQDGLSRLLGSLEDRDLVRREAVSRIRGDQQYAFKHALIRDVAYQRLPRAARRERHAEVARYLEETTGGAGQSLDALAHHWREAGEAAKAVDYLVEAAEQAGRGWAKDRALVLYTQALELLPADDPRRRTIRLRQAVIAQAFAHLIQDDVERPLSG
jgi:predicted ATPase